MSCLFGSLHLTFELQDEAFELGYRWANVYEANSVSRRLIQDMMDTFFLVNVVHNDFKDPQAIFEPFLKVGAECGLRVEGDASNTPQQVVTKN